MKLVGQITGMPQMRAAFAGWASSITLRKVVQTVIDDGIVSEESYDFTFKGVIQPLSPKQIALKPEGQRAWEWLQIHCLTQCEDLNVNDRVNYGGKIFKVMAMTDYSLNNYVEYHLVKDYQDE